MTDRSSDQLAAIRAVAERCRDYAGWTEVCALLDAWSDDTVRAQLDELERELRTWPAELRIAPPRWVARLRAEGREPRALLCRVLDFVRTADRGELWRALESSDAARADTLRLGDCALDEAVAPELARRLRGTGVRRLALSGNPIGAGIAHVLRLSIEGTLASLDAESCELGAGVLGAVVASGAESRLSGLGLGLNHLAPSDLEHLARLPGLDKLERLGFGGNKFGAAGVRVLVERAPLGGLRELVLEGTQCADAGAAAIASAPVLARLEKLSLMSCGVRDAGAAALAGSTALAALRELDLTYNRLTAAGAGALLAAGSGLPALKTLELDHNDLEDDAVEVIASSPRLARLARLTLDDTFLSDDARARLEGLPLPEGVLDLYLLRED